MIFIGGKSVATFSSLTVRRISLLRNCIFMTETIQLADDFSCMSRSRRDISLSKTRRTSTRRSQRENGTEIYIFSLEHSYGT